MTGLKTDNMKLKLITAALMGMITTGLISFTLVALNYGFKPDFTFIWLRSWAIAFLIAFFTIVFLGAKVQLFSAYLLNKTAVFENRRRTRKAGKKKLHKD